MSETPPEQVRWGAYDAGPKDHVHAVGVVAIRYNRLESTLYLIFSRFLPLEQEVSLHLFGKLNNATRTDLLKQMIPTSKLHSGLKEALIHFLACFDVCAENRNVLMHSVTRLEDNSDLLSFLKRSKDKPSRINEISMKIADIRRVADEINHVENFGFMAYLYSLTNKPDALLGIPQKPSKLLIQTHRGR